VRKTADAVRAPGADTFRMSRRTLVLVSVGAAVVAAGVLVGLFAFASSGTKAPPAAAVQGAGRVTNLLQGIPHHGTTLGNPSAPVTLVEFADPQCPYCGEWERGALPTIVSRYVRTGKVRIVFEGLAFVGADSVTALRTALAAAPQNRFWNVLELLYENQGAENTGWVTDSLLHQIGAAIPDLDSERMFTDRSSSAVDRAITQADTAARDAGVTATPSFAVGPTGGQFRLVHVSSLTASALTPALDAALKQ
jgi:protein-disulfide isomerase